MGPLVPTGQRSERSPSDRRRLESRRIEHSRHSEWTQPSVIHQIHRCRHPPGTERHAAGNCNWDAFPIDANGQFLWAHWAGCSLSIFVLVFISILEDTHKIKVNEVNSFCCCFFFVRTINVCAFVGRAQQQSIIRRYLPPKMLDRNAFEVALSMRQNAW